MHGRDRSCPAILEIVRPCLFCGSTSGRPTEEHVLPKWAQRSFNVRNGVTLYASDRSYASGRQRIGRSSQPRITLKGAICESCNNGWLSQLEADVQPILLPMVLTADSVRLDALAQRLLATWAVKTVLLIEIAVRQHYPTSRPIRGYTASDVELAWLLAHRSPPPRSLVWLGCWDCEQETPAAYEPSGAPLPTADGHPVAGHFTTFSLGYVVFQVFTVDYVAADEHKAQMWNSQVPTSLRESLHRLWPVPRGTAAWPPKPFPNAEWTRLVTWDQVLRPGCGGAAALRLLPLSFPLPC